MVHCGDAEFAVRELHNRSGQRAVLIDMYAELRFGVT
jgi:hypothetical protein